MLMIKLKYYKFRYSLILLFMFSFESSYCMNSCGYDTDIETFESLTESNETCEHKINIEDQLTFLSYIKNNAIENVKTMLKAYPILTNMKDPISPITYAVTQDDPEYDIIFTLIEFGCNVNPVHIKLAPPITCIINKINEHYEDMQLNILTDILKLLLKNESIVTEEMIILANESTVKDILSSYFYEEKQTSCKCSLM